MKDGCPDCEGLKDTRAVRCRSCDTQYRRASYEGRFWAKVNVTNPKDCWQWMGFSTPAGYGMVGQRGSHRLAYEFSIGPIPEGMCICHHCDNPGCCNPAHLFLGTYKDNSQDMVHKGRANSPFGIRVGSSKLIEREVLEIRGQYAKGGVSQRALAQQYGVSQRAINKILLRQSWTWLQE